MRLRYIPALDGLRGIAILLVMAHHAHVLPGGFIGVDIFFTLSGFLIATLLIQEFDRHGQIDLRAFYIRRALRLVPALLFMLIALNLYVLLFRPDFLKETLGNSLFALLYVTNWTSAFELVPSRYLLHTWSLAVEEQFYLLMPLVLIALLRYIPRRQMMRVFLALAGLSWAWRVVLVAGDAPQVRYAYGLDTRLDALLLGCALASFMASDAFLHHWRINGRHGGMAGGLLALMAVCANADADSTYSLVMPLTALATLILIACCLTGEGRVKRVLECPPLVIVGKLSYALYLWHMLFYVEWGYGTVGVVVIGTVAAFACAWMSYAAIETPLLRWKRRYSA